MTALHAIRFREEFEMRCDHCHTYWPITTEFWRRSLSRCNACDIAATARQREKTRRRRCEYARRWRAANHERHLTAVRRWYWAHREQVLAGKRAARRAA